MYAYFDEKSKNLNIDSFNDSNKSIYSLKMYTIYSLIIDKNYSYKIFNTKFYPNMLYIQPGWWL